MSSIPRMSLKRLLRAPVPISLVFVTLAVFALLLVPSIDSTYMRGEATHHRIRLGVFEYVEIDATRTDPANAWVVDWQVEALPLLETVALTLLLLWYGRRSMLLMDRLVAEAGEPRA